MLRERKKQRTARRIHEVALRLVAACGLSGITVHQICAQASVAPRTFFNYYPSKAAAVLGLPTLQIDEDERARFLGGHGTLVGDLCSLVAGVLESRGAAMRDGGEIKRIMGQDPELGVELFMMLRSFRHSLRDLAEERADPGVARLAVSLVSAACANAYGPACRDPEADLQARLREAVGRLGELARQAGAEPPQRGSTR